MYYIGYDIGGTKCAVSLGSIENDNITVMGKRQFPTGGTPYDVLAKMAEEMELLLSEHGLKFSDVVRAGISCGGPLDSVRGVILSPPNLPGWDEIPATDFLFERTGVETRLQNDANACAVAEWKFGAGRGASNMAFLTFGTGLGAGLILDGRLYSGASDMAGIARTGIAAVKKAMENGQKPALYDAVDGDLEKITARLIAEMANEGDEFCKEIYASCGRRLGMLLSFMMDMINPEVIVLGGVFMRSGHLIRPAMEQVIAEEALPHASKVCRVLPAGLGESIGDYAALSVAYM